MKFHSKHLYDSYTEFSIKGHDLKSHMAAMPIYGKKTFKRPLFQNHQTYLVDILQEAYKAPPYIKWLKSFQSDHKQTLSGWGKFGKNDIKFWIHGPSEHESCFC